MAHDAQRVFVNAVKAAYPYHFTNTRVVEMGSLDINGTVRDFFTDPIWYVGVDVGPGPGVDVVGNAAHYDHDGDYFDVAISAECFEHNPDWRETFHNMKRLVKEGGLVIFTCAGKDRPEHGTSRSDVGSSPLTVEIGWEYYRNLEEDDFTDEDLAGLDYRFFYEPYAKDLYFVGRKGGWISEIGPGEHWQ